jgi:hypothetical protein
MKTQLIDTTRNSQKLQDIRVLGSNEDNRIVDSSLDDREVDTQRIVDIEPGAFVIHEKITIDPSNGSNSNEENGKSQDSSAPFKRLKLPNADSPWLNRIADPFEDTPVINKIRSLKETPIHSKVIYAETPDTISRRVIDTPGDAAHKIFERLRENQGQPELDVDTQPLPSLGFDTQESKSTTQGMRIITNEDSSIIDTAIDEDTLADADNSANTTAIELVHDLSQAALQIPGTAPEEDRNLDLYDHMYISSPVVSEDEGPSKNDSSEARRSFNFNAEDSIQIKRDRDWTSRNPKSSPLQKTAELEDSSLWTKQPLNLKTNSFPGFHGSPSDALFSQVHILETPSRLGTAGKSQRLRVESLPSLMRTQVDPDSTGDISLNVEDVEAPQSPVSKENFPEIALNVTQELSDIDDDSSVNVTVEEEDPSILELPQDDEDNVVHRTKRTKRSKKRRRKTAVSSSVLGGMKTESCPDSLISSELPLLGSTVHNDTGETHSERFVNPTHQLQLLPEEVLKVDKSFLDETDMIFKSSVWYLYETFYYPGIVIGAEGSRLVVKFKDREQAVNGVSPLDIRLGDVVFHDDLEFIIIGLESVSKAKDTIRCMRGYDTLVVQPLKKKKKKKTETREWRLALQNVKMAEHEWLKVDRVGSEQEFLRRRTVLKPTVTFEDELIQHASRLPTFDKSKLFSGCIFALTDLDDRKKSELEQLIQRNGGKVSDDGFEHFMDIADDNHTLVPYKKRLIDYHFAALITTRTNRFPKFFECLALGWPVLSYEYIEHCIDQDKLLTNLWTYLLPSGISKHLHNVVKSTDISKFVEKWQNGESLESQLSNNRLLADQTVLMTEFEPRISEFLFHALGAETRHVKITTNAKLLSDCGDDEHVYLYAKSMTRVQKELKNWELHNSKGKSLTKNLLGKKEVEVEIIDWEWLVQCIISGYPWESVIIKLMN